MEIIGVISIGIVALFFFLILSNNFKKILGILFVLVFIIRQCNLHNSDKNGVTIEQKVKPIKNSTSIQEIKLPKYNHKLNYKEKDTYIQKRSNGYSRTYYRGPRGGCYYINSNGNKTYVDRSLCN